MRREPTILPSLVMRLPAASFGKTSWAIPVTTSGYTTPVITVRIRNSTRAGRISERIWVTSSNQMRQHQTPVNELDSRERNENTSQAVDQQVTPQEHGSPQGAVLHPLQCQRDQEHDDQRVEDDGRQNGRKGARQAHDIQGFKLRVGGRESGRNDREIL